MPPGRRARAKNQGRSGTMAPTEKARNDETAAPTGEPSSPGSMPSSSRAWASRASSGSLIMASASSGPGGWHAPGLVDLRQLDGLVRVAAELDALDRARAPAARPGPSSRRTPRPPSRPPGDQPGQAGEAHDAGPGRRRPPPGSGRRSTPGRRSPRTPRPGPCRPGRRGGGARGPAASGGSRLRTVSIAPPYPREPPYPWSAMPTRYDHDRDASPSCSRASRATASTRCGTACTASSPSPRR